MHQVYFHILCMCASSVYTLLYTVFVLGFHLCACFCVYVHAHCLECLHEASPSVLGGSTVFRWNKMQSIPVGQTLSSRCSRKNSFIPNAIFLLKSKFILKPCLLLLSIQCVSVMWYLLLCLL